MTDQKVLTMRALIRVLCFCCVAGALSNLTGCGKSQMSCVKATCELTLDGKPFGPATAAFYRVGAKAEDRTTNGTFDKSGEGKLSTYQLGDGIPVGDYKVTVVTGGIGRSPIAKEYAQESKTPLKVQVFANSDVLTLNLEPIKASSKEGSPLDRFGAKSNDDLLQEAMDPNR